jgi:hypothetical protein
MGELNFKEINGHFIDRYEKPVTVLEVTGGQLSAFVYSCGLNLDKDGAVNAYGYDNPSNPKQHDLTPLEFAGLNIYDKKRHKKIGTRTTMQRQRIGLGNACGDPGDGTKGHKNFGAGGHNFWWAGIKALTKDQADRLNMQIDDRPELEAAREKLGGAPKPPGKGYFPVVDPATGYYISTTSLAADGSASTFSNAHYLDAAVIPYAVWANAWRHVSVGGKMLHLGDFGLAIENKTGNAIGFVYGDAGTSKKVGECSKKIYDTLGGESGLVTFIAFPGSGSGRMVKPRHGKSYYQMAALGSNPELLIQQKARLHMMALDTNAAQLAEQVSSGSPHQAHLKKQLMAALSSWTVTV